MRHVESLLVSRRRGRAACGVSFLAVSVIDDAVIIVFFLMVGCSDDNDNARYSRCSHEGFKNCSKIFTSTAADDCRLKLSTSRLPS